MVHTLLVMIRGSQSEAIGFAFCVIIYIYTILVKTLVWLWLGSHVSFFFFSQSSLEERFWNGYFSIPFVSLASYVVHLLAAILQKESRFR